MVVRRGRFLFAFAGLAAAQAAAAQDQATGADIVVEGKRLPRAEAQARAAELVRAFGVANGQRPAARWTSPVCLKVIGLPDDQKAAIAARFEAIARDARVPLAEPGCSPNALLTFTDDGARETRSIAEKQPRQLEELPRDTREHFLEAARAARWWYNTTLTGKDGMPPSTNEPAGLTYASGGGDAVPSAGSINVSGEGGSLNQQGSSIVSTQARRNIVGVTVIVDSTQSPGVPVENAADFGILVMLAEITPGAKSTGDTVLRAFDGPGSPDGLTAWDVAFLNSLYRIALDRRAGQHRARLAGAMTEQLGASKKD